MSLLSCLIVARLLVGRGDESNLRKGPSLHRSFFLLLICDVKEELLVPSCHLFSKR